MPPESPEKPRFHLHFGDCIPFMAEMRDASVDLSIFSPPFMQLYSYTSLPEDIGNSEDFAGDAKLHLSFFFRQFARVLKPGRVVVVHCMQVPRMKRAGGQGLFDFRGMLIRLAERAGLIFEYDWVIRKNPQAQAILTKSRELQFAGLESDRARCRGALPDYLLKFTAPGSNEVPVDSLLQVSRNDWIDWAECCWEAEKYPIDGTGEKAYTLNTDEGKGENDTKHICPLQLSIIDRVVRLFSNPKEVVFSPFTGIGSEAYVTLRLDRRFLGCEIKPEYYQAAMRRIEKTLRYRRQAERTLFDGLENADEVSFESAPAEASSHP